MRRSTKLAPRLWFVRVVGIATIFLGAAPLLGVGIPAGAALLIGGLALLAQLDRRYVGTLLLSVWLLASGFLFVLNVSIPSSGTILSILAIVAGVLVLLER